jgi:hypothetical protein
MMFYLVVCSDGQNTGEGQTILLIFAKNPSRQNTNADDVSRIICILPPFHSRVRIQEGFREIIPLYTVYITE